MSKLNARQVAIRTGGNYADLEALLDRRIVKRIPFVDTQDLACAAVQYKLIPSTILSGLLAVGVATVTSGGYIVAALAGAVGTAAATIISDALGNVLNMVAIRDAVTHDEIQVGVGENARTVYGLLQCSSDAEDGEAIGEAGSENLQISFVYYAEDGTLTLTAITADIEFQANKVYTLRNIPVIEMENGNVVPDILQKDINPFIRSFVVTTAFAADEVITLSTGAGGVSGESTPSGDTLALNASDALFLADRTMRVRLNGVQVIKGAGKDVVWDTSDSMHFTTALDVGDTFEIERIVQA